MMTKIKNYLSRNPLFLKTFADFLTKEKAKSKITSIGGNKGIYLTDYKLYATEVNANRFVTFYEWSEINGTTKTFKNLKEFLDFLIECKIPFTYGDAQDMAKLNYMHAICKKGTTQIVFAPTKTELCQKIK